MLGESSKNAGPNVVVKFSLDEFRCFSCNLKFEDKFTFDSHLCGKYAKDKISACNHENCQNSFNYDFLFHEHITPFHDKNIVPHEKVIDAKKIRRISLNIEEEKVLKTIKLDESDEHVKNGYSYSKKNLFDKTLGSDMELKAESGNSMSETSLVCTLCGNRLDTTYKFTQHSCRLVKHALETAPDSCNKEFSNASPDSKIHNHKANITLKSEETVLKSSGDTILDSDSERVSTEIKCIGEQTLESAGNNFKKFKCVTCDKIFTSEKSFKKHSSIRCLLKPFFCETCGMSFKRRQHLLIHTRSHTGEQPYSCPDCGKKYVHRKSLITHLQTHTGETLTCDVCGKTFRAKTFLLQHMRYHDQSKIFKCSVCNEKFIYISSLNEHARVHKNERLFLCDTCGAKFNRKAHLVIHIRTHTRERNFNCSLCGATYAHKKDLSNHARSHEGGPKLSCYMCCERFATKAYLRIHMLLHIGKRSYGCQVCKKMFTHIAALKRHKNTHNIEEFLKLA